MKAFFLKAHYFCIAESDVYLNSTHITDSIFAFPVQPLLREAPQNYDILILPICLCVNFFFRFDWNVIIIDTIYSFSCVFVFHINKKI